MTENVPEFSAESLCLHQGMVTTKWPLELFHHNLTVCAECFIRNYVSWVQKHSLPKYQYISVYIIFCINHTLAVVCVCQCNGIENIFLQKYSHDYSKAQGWKDNAVSQSHDQIYIQTFMCFPYVLPIAQINYIRWLVKISDTMYGMLKYINSA